MGLENMLLIAVTSLSTAVATLFAFLHKQWKEQMRETRNRLKSCEEDRSDLWEHVRTIESKLNQLTPKGGYNDC